jgi:hypothetical protein
MESGDPTLLARIVAASREDPAFDAEVAPLFGDLGWESAMRYLEPIVARYQTDEAARRRLEYTIARHAAHEGAVSEAQSLVSQLCRGAAHRPEAYPLLAALLWARGRALEESSEEGLPSETARPKPRLATLTFPCLSAVVEGGGCATPWIRQGPAPPRPFCPSLPEARQQALLGLLCAGRQCLDEVTLEARPNFVALIDGDFARYLATERGRRAEAMRGDQGGSSALHLNGTARGTAKACRDVGRRLAACVRLRSLHITSIPTPRLPPLVTELARKAPPALRDLHLHWSPPAPQIFTGQRRAAERGREDESIGDEGGGGLAQQLPAGLDRLSLTNIDTAFAGLAPAIAACGDDLTSLALNFCFAAAAEEDGDLVRCAEGPERLEAREADTALAAMLPSMRRLRVLGLGHARLSDQCLRAIYSLAELRSLVLTDVAFQCKGSPQTLLAALASLGASTPALESLTLNSYFGTNEGSPSEAARQTRFGARAARRDRDGGVLAATEPLNTLLCGLHVSRRLRRLYIHHDYSAAPLSEETCACLATALSGTARIEDLTLCGLPIRDAVVPTLFGALARAAPTLTTLMLGNFDVLKPSTFGTIAATLGRCRALQTISMTSLYASLREGDEVFDEAFAGLLRRLSGTSSLRILHVGVVGGRPAELCRSDAATRARLPKSVAAASALRDRRAREGLGVNAWNVVQNGLLEYQERRAGTLAQRRSSGGGGAAAAPLLPPPLPATSLMNALPAAVLRDITGFLKYEPIPLIVW